MSAPLGARVRRNPPGPARHLVPLLSIPLVIAALAAGLASAELPSAAVRIGPAQAAASGQAIHLERRAIGGSTLVEVVPVASAASSEATGNLLAVSPDGSQAALADQVGELSGSLTLARADGSQLRIQLPGLIGAGFAADGSWLAVIDGHGALWQVDAASGRASQRADGPFIGSPIAAADGSLLLLAVSSVEAPYRSQLVRLDPSTGVSTSLSAEELVYGGFPLVDGDVAVVAHRAGHTVVLRVGSGGSRLLADLVPNAINVAVAPDGAAIAFELTERGIFLLEHGAANPRPVGQGSRPCFAADGASLLVHRGTGTAALSTDGAVIAVTDRPAAFAGSAGCLP